MTKIVPEDRRFALLDRDHQICEYSGNVPEAAALRSGIYSPDELEELAKMIREGQAKGDIPAFGFNLVAFLGGSLEMITSFSGDAAALGMLT
jgi:hypothetical protein